MHYIKDTYRKRLDLYFDGFPEAEVLNFLKNEGWKWNRAKRCWFHYLSQEHLETVTALGAVPYSALPDRSNKEIVPMPSAAPRLPALDELYKTPAAAHDIRIHPSSKEELISLGISVNGISSYMEQMHCLYLAVTMCTTDIEPVWMELVEVCKECKLIRRDFCEDVGDVEWNALSDTTFETFRLDAEFLLTGNDPFAQFLKCAYNIDVMYFEWWRPYWLPTDYQLGHASGVKTFVPLSYNELLNLRSRSRWDFQKGRYSDIPPEDLAFLEQVILWNLEQIELPSAFEDHTLYIHKGRIICQTRHHEVLQATAILSSLSGADVALNVNYCTQCKKFFMDYRTYQHYRDRYSALLGDIKMLKREDYKECEDCLAEESPLHLCGYTVAEKASLSASERRGIIVFVIDRGIMTKEQIISHLNWLIDTNRHRENMDNAVRKWNAALSFVLQYDMENQVRCFINDFKKYHPNQFKINRRHTP